MPIKKIVPVLLLLILALVVYYFVSGVKLGNSSVLSNFSVKDTSSITKIFMADKKGNTILLDRSDGKDWVLNGKYGVNKQPLKILLETIESISVKTPVSKGKFETIIRQLAGRSVKVEIYQGEDKPSKVYYVGHGNQESSGTYMILEGSDVPFLVHIEGFKGYVTPRYFTNEKQWRNTEIFSYDLYDIHQITCQNHVTPSNSFRINLKEGEYALYDFPGMNKLPMDTAKMLLYSAQYKKIHFEFFVTDSNLTFIDSIKNTTPLFTYEVIDRNNQQRSITTYKIKHKEALTNMGGELEEYDVDRMYGILNDGSLVMVQYHVFDPLSPPKRYLLKSTPQ